MRDTNRDPGTNRKRKETEIQKRKDEKHKCRFEDAHPSPYGQPVSCLNNRKNKKNGRTGHE